jgi:hypothetical protein
LKIPGDFLHRSTMSVGNRRLDRNASRPEPDTSVRH